MGRGVDRISQDRRQEKDSAGAGGGSVEVTKRSQGMGTLTEVKTGSPGDYEIERGESRESEQG